MNLAERLSAEISKKQRRIVVAGDVMVDRWVHGHVERCQDGCPKFVQEGTIDTPGGAANAARSLDGWRVRVNVYGHWPNNCPVKRRYVEDGQVVFRADDDCTTDLATSQRQRNAAMEMIPHADAVLLSDYDKGFLTPEFIRDLADLCRRRGIPCVADCKRAPEVYEGCVLKGNSEWSMKHDPLGVDVVTAGALFPCVLGEEIGPIMSNVPCFNHVGAGDCFAAHLTLALTYGFSLKEAAALAHSAGRVYVQHPHNRPPLPVEIVADMSTAH